MRRFLSLLLFVTFSVSLMAQNGKNVTVKWLKDNYTKREVMIPMRDGSDSTPLSMNLSRRSMPNQ